MCAFVENPLGYIGPRGGICTVIYLLVLVCIISILVGAALLYMNDVICDTRRTQGELESSSNAMPPWAAINITHEQRRPPHSRLELTRLNKTTSSGPKGGGPAPQPTSGGGNQITTRSRMTGVPSTGIQQRCTPRTPGEILMGITDTQAEAQLATLRNRIKSREDLELSENKQWAERQLAAMPAIRLPSVQAVIEPGEEYTPEPAYRSMYAVRDFMPSDLTRETLHKEMRLLTSIRTTGDGNCHDRSTMTSLTGREEGHMGLRLRNALYFVAHHNKLVLAGATSDYKVFTELSTPNEYVDATASALTALTLQCPVAVIAPLGVQSGSDHCNIYIPPIIQPGANVILKAWTGTPVRHPPTREIPNSSGEALYHYCTVLARSTKQIDTLVAGLNYHPLMSEDVVESNRSTFNLADIPNDQIDVDEPQDRPMSQQKKRANVTYAEAAKQNTPTNPLFHMAPPTTKPADTTRDGKPRKPAPQNQRTLEGWIQQPPPRPTPATTKLASKPHHRKPAPPPTQDNGVPIHNSFGPLGSNHEEPEEMETQGTQAEPSQEAPNKYNNNTTTNDGRPTWPMFHPNQRPTPAPQQGREAQPARTPSTTDTPWKVYTENVRGLTADNTVAEMEAIILTTQPDVILFTETQLTTMAKGRGSKIHRQILSSNYIVLQSPASEITRGQGVLVAINRQIASQTMIKDVTTPTALTGIVKQVVIHRQGWIPLAVTAVYIPCGLRKKKLRGLYTTIKEQMLDTTQDMIHMMGGDWNAELPHRKKPGKRLKTRDRELVTFTTEAKLVAIPRMLGHEHKDTFRDVNSIDQTFLRTPAGNCGDMGNIQGHEEIIDIWGDDTPYTHSDHNALLTTLHLTEHGLLKPSGLQTASETGERRLVLPLTQEEHRILQTRTRAELREALQEIQEEAREIR